MYVCMYVCTVASKVRFELFRVTITVKCVYYDITIIIFLTHFLVSVKFIP